MNVSPGFIIIYSSSSLHKGFNIKGYLLFPLWTHILIFAVLSWESFNNSILLLALFISFFPYKNTTNSLAFKSSFSCFVSFSIYKIFSSNISIDLNISKINPLFLLVFSELFEFEFIFNTILDSEFFACFKIW